MNIRILCHAAAIALALPLLAACDPDGDNGTDAGAEHAMTEEKYRLIGLAIKELSTPEYGQLPPEGAFVLSDRTTIGEATEGNLAADPDLTLVAALDFNFPHDHMLWSPEEADLAFAGYYQANLESVSMRLEDVAPIERDFVLLMHEQFEEYDTYDDPLAGWSKFYADYPDVNGYLRLGVPVIFREAGMALVHVDFLCDAICGVGFYALFRWDDGEWKFSDWYTDYAR